ncbi:MAG: flavin reductase family protein [Proteobacteria bacterium]|nr:flavin reductase family protein [Pseudomonadota bacterium]
MKQVITPEFLWHLQRLCMVFQVTIVTTVDKEGRVNAAPFGLVIPYSADPEKPQMMLNSNRMWHTAQNIEATCEFVINYPSFSLYPKVSEAGKLYDEGVNELEKAGLTAIPANKVKPPRIKECYQHIECRLAQVMYPNEHQSNFIGDIVNISLDEEFLSFTQQEKIKKADPLLLFGINLETFASFYLRAGENREFSPE